MAQVIENEKGFKVIETSRAEMVGVFGFAVCDSCNKVEGKGYLICVLNQWYCSGCFDQWISLAKNYPDDRKIEQRNYQAYTEIFRVV